MSRSVDWTGLAAPSLADLEMLTHQAFERLPKPFRDMCGDVTLRVEDFATDEVLELAGDRLAVRSARPLFRHRSRA